VGAEHRPVVVAQRGGRDCGPAAAATLAALHGYADAARALPDALEVSRRGVSVLQLVHALQQQGVPTRAWHTSYDGLAGLPRPALLHLRARTAWGRGHFVVLDSWHTDGVRVLDPARPGRAHSRSRDRLESRWSGLVVTVA
jgi:ABC-type bacteriocin/lantibiotic exporter with double-glycine peptidase domain